MHFVDEVIRKGRSTVWVLKRRIQKLLDEMAENPAKDWRIEEVLKVAAHAEVITSPPSSGSHYTFASPHLEEIRTVPHKRPIKPVYIRAFAKWVKLHLEKAEE